MTMWVRWKSALCRSQVRRWALLLAFRHCQMHEQRKAQSTVRAVHGMHIWQVPPPPAKAPGIR